MAKNAAKILQEALRLDANERAQVASELLASLEESQDEIDQAWAAEIMRRAEEARRDESGAEEEDWRTALARIEAEVLGR